MQRCKDLIFKKKRMQNFHAILVPSCHSVNQQTLSQTGTKNPPAGGIQWKKTIVKEIRVNYLCHLKIFEESSKHKQTIQETISVAYVCQVTTVLPVPLPKSKNRSPARAPTHCRMERKPSGRISSAS